MSAHHINELGEAAYELASIVVRSRPRDMSLTAASTLASLDRGGPRRLGELAATEGVAQPSMTALVGQLEQSGLVERRRDPTDGRGVLVGITPAGRDRLDRRRRAASEDFARLAGRLSDEEVGALAAAVPVLRRLFDLATDRPMSAPGVRA